MAEAVVSMVAERFGNLLIEEAKLIHGLRDQVRDIRDELWWMQSFLKDADARQHEDHRVRTWVREIKEIAYDAGDILESFVLGVESRRGGSILNVLRRYACIVSEGITRHKVGSKIQAIEARISKLTTRLQTYGIRSLSEDRESSSSVSQRQSQLRRSYSHVDEDDFVGLEEDVKKLVKYLLIEDQGRIQDSSKSSTLSSEDQNAGVGCSAGGPTPKSAFDEDQAGYHQVVAICGMGGLGKTTLAKKIYHHAKVKSHFDALAWVCISQQWQLTTILQQILVKLIPSKKDQIHKERDDGQLMNQIYNVQEEKKCLVVLDDIWTESAWDSMKDAFPMNTMKGKLLLTSRKINVVKHVDPEVFVHEPKLLNDDECLKLLKKKAFTMQNDPDVKEKKEELARGMIRECGRLPLAVIVLGGILATKHSLREWDTVRQSIKSYLRRGEGMGQQDGAVSKILGLSYNDLPYQLKPCFLYLGKFKEDTEIEAERLYQLWMAESMILSEDHREGETMMDVAECYLDELAQRCMVQVQIKKDKYTRKKIKICRLHDLMRDLCLLKAKEEDFFNTVDFQCENNSERVESSFSFTNKSRRVVIYFDDEKINSRIFSVDKETSQLLRSLLFFDMSWGYTERVPRIVRSQLNDFKMLRVLAIEGLRSVFFENYHEIKQRANYILDHLALSQAVGKLIHLRYLSLRESKFFMIPSSINNLKHLQTLDLRGWFYFYHECSANVLRKMRRLQHLYLPKTLRHQCFKPTKLQLGSLSNLETLENFDSSMGDSKGLSKLINLRKLRAVLRENLKEVEPIIDYLSSTAAKNMRYSDLDIWYVDFDSAKGHTILIKILRCCHLHKLEINTSFCKKLPGYDEVPNLSQSLTTLTLSYFHLEEDPMPTLEKLLNLMKLRLAGAFRGRTMVCSDKGFPQLKSLGLKFMEYIDSWTVEEGAMPKLSQLNIVCCKSLKTVPDGLRFITTLRELVIEDMGEEFKRRVQVVDGEEGQDLYKIRHVTSITIRSSPQRNY